jgi:hypothetical protein
MITKPTVLILGAGASSVYGFPTGEKLVSNIIFNLRPLLKNETRVGVNVDWVPFLIDNFEINEEDIYDFQEKLDYARISVDAFLEYSNEFLEVGKLAIALSLISNEKNKKLFNADKNWLDYLRIELDAPFDVFGENKLSIITFNYDRSIEQYLFTVLKNTYGRSNAECVEQLSKIPIIHVHGKLGSLPWQEKNGRPYENKITPENIKLASDQIIIISESNEDSKEFRQAFELLKNADEGKIYFLGFGFNPVNLRRLKFNELKNLKKLSPIAMETSFNFPATKQRVLADEWKIHTDWQTGQKKRDILDFLRDTAIIE